MSAMRGAPQEHAFDEELVPAQAQQDTLLIDDLRDVPATVSAELGHTQILVRDILGLERGSVLTLSKSAGEMADVLVNGVHISRGEVVVLGDSLNIRIAEIYGLAEKEVVEP